jgi:type III secretion system YscD/HrpQ family protein
MDGHEHEHDDDSSFGAQMHDDAIELRVLHGPQSGSTLPFEPGQEYTVGTADTCAVLLAGSQIEPEHVTLCAQGDGIQVLPLQGKVLTLERMEVPYGDRVRLGTVLRIGRVLLTVDRVEAPWPEEEVLEEPATAAAPAPSREVQEPVTNEAAVPNRASAKPARRARRSRSFFPTLMLGSAATLLMGAAVAAWVTSADAQKAADAAAAQAAQGAASAPVRAGVDIAELSRSFPEATLRATQAADGHWIVGGRISSENARKRLREAVSALPGHVETHVLLDSERQASVLAFVQKHRVAGMSELGVRPGNAGALRIVGAVATPQAVAALTQAAQAELADAGPLEFEILSRLQLQARLQERLHAAGLDGRFKVTGTDDARLDLKAVLTPQEVRTWENLFAEFTREYGSVLTVTAQVQQERDQIESHIEAVVAGSFPYVMTTGGKRIAPGGALDGRTLVAIRNGELLFSDGLRVRYAD